MRHPRKSSPGVGVDVFQLFKKNSSRELVDAADDGVTRKFTAT
jgi:hypothetical protein